MHSLLDANTAPGMLFCLQLAFLAAPAQVQIVLLDDSPELRIAAQELQRALGPSPEFTPRENILSPVAPEAPPIERLRQQLGRAREAYNSLDTSRALELIQILERDLGVWLRLPEALRLYATALRLKGQILMVRGDRTSAARAFATAFFLEPEHSPVDKEWPPEMRLAYADAIAHSKRSPHGVLSVRVTPNEAEVWLDGQQRATGSTTVSELAPGTHLLTIYAPGHLPVSASIPFEGQGKLKDVSFFLKAKTSEEAAQDYLGALRQRWQGSERAKAAQVLRQHRSADLLIVLTPSSTAPLPAQPGSPELWIFDGDARRQGQLLRWKEILQNPSLLLAPTPQGTMLTPGPGGNGATARPVSLPPPPNAWYRAPWFLWTAGSIAAVLGGTGLYFGLRDRSSDRVKLVIGRP